MITTAELWRDALDLANAANNELRIRVAVNSLYYAIFLQVRTRLDLRRTNNEGEHAEVIEQLRRRGTIERRAAGRVESLRRLRNKAQYDTKLTVTKVELEEARRHAEAIRLLLPTMFEP